MLLTVCLLVVWLVVAGCSTYVPGAPDRIIADTPPPIPKEIWPIRYPEAVFARLEDGAYLPVRRTFRGGISRPGTEELRLLSVRLELLGVYGTQHAARVVVSDADRQRRGFEWSEMYWMHSSTLSADDLLTMVKRQGPGVDVGEHSFLTVVRVYPPEPRRLSESDGQPRGLAVLLTGLAGFGPERGVMRELRRRGWVVAVLTPPTNTVGRGEVLLGEGKLKVGDDGLVGLAQMLANLIDDGLAEWAYSVEATLALLEDQHPALLDSPTVIGGFSLGAIALPAAVARQPERFDAAVLAGGGANVLDIANRSWINRRGVRVLRDGDPISDEEWGRLLNLYLDRSRLDPHNTAMYLRSMPVLTLHAKTDGIVPADTGELLHELLGQPEQIRFPMGHLGLSWMLPRQARRIATWYEEAVEQHGAANRLPADE